MNWKSISISQRQFLFQSGLYQLCSRPIILCLLLVCNDQYLAPNIKYLSRLGYCNSAINPVIYGLFSREFRAAFKKIICKFFCKVDLITATLPLHFNEGFYVIEEIIMNHFHISGFKIINVLCTFASASKPGEEKNGANAKNKATPRR